MRRLHLSTFPLFVALAFVFSGARASASPLWGDLKPGPHAVGYRTIFTHDLSRPAIAGTRARGRQMQINVWYPARAPRGLRPMRYGEYVGLLFREVDFEPAGGAGPERLAEKFMENPVELGGEAARIKPHAAALLGTGTAAFEDAPAAAGRFPLVVFPAYRSPAVQSIMCEYLASHGFVVASAGMKGTHEAEPEINVAGMETLAADSQFVIGLLRAAKAFDGERVALMGVGFNASSCFALQTRNTDVDALVSLDGGIITGFEDRMIKRTPFYDLAAVRVPALFIHAPHPSVDPSFIEQYRYSTRHVVHFPRMSEFYFLNYGMIERLVPGVIGTPPGDTKAGFEWAARYVLHFLKAYLGGDAKSLEFLKGAPEANGAPRDLLTAVTKEGLRPAAPTLSELKALFKAGGIGGVAALYRELKKNDPQPLSQEKFVDFYNWLSFNRDPDWKARRELALLRVDSYPDSSRAHFTLAQVALQLKDTELARKHFNEALRLVAADADPALDPATRRRIELTARQNLEKP